MDGSTQLTKNQYNIAVITLRINEGTMPNTIIPTPDIIIDANESFERTGTSTPPSLKYIYTTTRR